MKFIITVLVLKCSQN